MKGKMATGVVALFVLVCAVGVATAQYASTPDNSATSDTHKSVRTLTGCLQKGEDSNEFNLMAQDGSTWEVKSDSVDLAPHVGHTVTLTGAVAHAKAHEMKEETKEEAKEHGMDKSAKEHGHLTVTQLSMVSETCQK